MEKGAKMKVYYRAVFEKGEDDYYGVRFPALDGCFSGGDSFVEAYENAQESLGLYISTLEERGKKATPDDVEIYFAKDKEQLAVVITDMKKYRPKKAVKKTLSIPYWLNELAEKEHINFSGVLQEALKKRLSG